MPTIDEAIEIKERWFKDGWVPSKEAWEQADRLSIEALKRCQFIREHYISFYTPPLPGETR